MGAAVVASEYCFDDCWSPVMGHIESFLISNAIDWLGLVRIIL